MELLHGGVCGAEFVEQFQTPPKSFLNVRNRDFSKKLLSNSLSK